MKKNFLLKNILFVQDSSPCIRTIKLATALKSKGLKVHLAYINRTPDEVYGYGNSSFISLNKLSKYNFQKIKFIIELIKKNDISLLHYHNQPDILGAKIINANLNIPIIYDQHDCMSFKHRLSRKEKKSEKICNENANGIVYITSSYKDTMSKYYKLPKNSICFGNYFPIKNLLTKEEELPKLSDTDNKIHLVYLGRISENLSDHRNIIFLLKNFNKELFKIHIYPSRDKNYMKYAQISNVIIHNNLPYNKLIKEISQYNFGLTLFNNSIVRKLPIIIYALGNKTYDYLSAGLPVIAQDCLKEVKDFILKNKFGFVLENEPSYINLSKKEYRNMVENIRTNRVKFTMENQIHRLIDFYNTTLEKFYEKA
jgi:hypothetical protein